MHALKLLLVIKPTAFVTASCATSRLTGRRPRWNGSHVLSRSACYAPLEANFPDPASAIQRSARACLRRIFHSSRCVPRARCQSQPRLGCAQERWCWVSARRCEQHSARSRRSGAARTPGRLPLKLHRTSARGRGSTANRSCGSSVLTTIKGVDDEGDEDVWAKKYGLPNRMQDEAENGFVLCKARHRSADAGAVG